MLTRSLFALPTLLLFSQMAHAAPLSGSYRIATRSDATRFDSVGIERRDGRRYVLHRVDQGQTLYGVARRYRTSVDAIRTANPDLGDDGVRYDQLLRVPVGAAPLTKKEQREADKAARKDEKTARADEAKSVSASDRSPAESASAAPKARTDRASSASDGTHVVETGQTLYGLAARYGVSMAELRRWNNLGADGIQVGQTIIVSEQAYLAKHSSGPTAGRSVASSASRPVSTASKATEPVTTNTEVTKLEAKPLITPDPPLAPGSKPRSKTKPATPETAEPMRRAEPVTERASAESRPAPRPLPERTQPTEKPERAAAPKATPPRSDNEPVATAVKPKPAGTVNVQSEVGFADVIEGDNQSSKYLALHRSAPVGTLVQVRNDISNQSLYVKVVGKLPDTGINDQVLIRLSNRAFEKLSPNGQRFRAEVSYAK